MKFDPKKHLIKVQGNRDYLPVAARLQWFREEHPDWGVDTKPVVIDVDKGIAVFQANVFDAEGRLMASGTKMETARGFGDFVEKAETGSIGRALGVLGYGTQFAPEFDEGERMVDSPQGHGHQIPVPSGAANISTGFSACAECSRPLTKGQADFSTMRFGRPLCPTHQKAGAPAPPPPPPKGNGKPAPLRDVREGDALASLHFAAAARGLSDTDLLNMAGPRFGVETLEELDAESAKALEADIRANYEEAK